VKDKTIGWLLLTPVILACVVGAYYMFNEDFFIMLALVAGIWVAYVYLCYAIDLISRRD